MTKQDRLSLRKLLQLVVVLVGISVWAYETVVPEGREGFLWPFLVAFAFLWLVNKYVDD